MPDIMFMYFLVFCALVESGEALLEDVVFQNKCIEDLGCFYTGPPFYHPLFRPISLPPSDKVRAKFLLFTPENPKKQEELNITQESLDSSSFDPTLPIAVLVHGFHIRLTVNDVIYQIKDALLNEIHCNMIIVDWTDYNGRPYAQAVPNARVVAAEIAKLLNMIMNMYGIPPINIYIIGHSLGAHIAGWVGERIPNIARITGLDPAGPFFQKAPNEVRLDSTDALFVDVMHTDGGENVADGLGINLALGHMDFYPNGGRSQPSCALSSEIGGPIGAVVNATGKVLNSSCHHNLAYNYFLESIDDSECRFLATQCNSYEDFEKGRCPPQNSTLSEMGLHARKISGLPMQSKFYLRTNAKSPYCMQNSVYLTSS